METNELRIGNWVSLPPVGGIEYQIRMIGIYVELYKNVGRWDISKLKPIPIDDDWLERIGFDEDGILKIDDNLWIVWDEEQRIDLTTDCKQINYQHCLYKGKYVHQMQNLYFALTNKELTLK